MRTTLHLVLGLFALLGLALPAAADLPAPADGARTELATSGADGLLPQEGAAEEAQEAAEEAVPAEVGGSELPQWQQTLDDVFGRINGWLEGVVFYPLPFFGTNPDGSGRTLPFAVLWLVLGAIFFTIRMGFINLRAFRHAIDVVRGRFTDPNKQGAGEVSHFQALTTALSATVGLGNIAGVAIAVSIGGPGATFWMICAGILGMSS